MENGSMHCSANKMGFTVLKMTDLAFGYVKTVKNPKRRKFRVFFKLLELTSDF